MISHKNKDFFYECETSSVDKIIDAHRQTTQDAL